MGEKIKQLGKIFFPNCLIFSPVVYMEAAAAGGAETAGLLVNIAGRQRTILQMLLKHVTWSDGIP